MHPWNDACVRFATLSNYVIFKLMQGWHFHRFKDPIHHNKFFTLISWSIDWLIELVEDQNEFVTWAFTIALFPLWRFLCLLIDFMLAVQSPHRAVRAQRVSLVHSRGVTQVGKPSPMINLEICQKTSVMVISGTKKSMDWPFRSTHIETSLDCVHLNSTSHF